MLGSMIQSGQDACERPGKTGHGVREDRPREGRETRRVAVGAEHKPGRTLRGDTLHDVREQRRPAEPEQRLVAPAHPPGQPAC